MSSPTSPNQQISFGRQVLDYLNEKSSQAEEIADGFTNLFLEHLNLLSPDAQAVYAARYAKCLTCPVRINNTCSKHQFRQRVGKNCRVHGCGCNLGAKTKSPAAWCPAYEWGPIHPDTLEELPFPKDKSDNLCR